MPKRIKVTTDEMKKAGYNVDGLHVAEFVCRAMHSGDLAVGMRGLPIFRRIQQHTREHGKDGTPLPPLSGQDTETLRDEETVMIDRVLQRVCIVPQLKSEPLLEPGPRELWLDDMSPEARRWLMVQIAIGSGLEGFATKFETGAGEIDPLSSAKPSS